MNRPTIVRTMLAPPPLLLEAWVATVLPLRCSLVFSPVDWARALALSTCDAAALWAWVVVASELAPKATAACVSVRAPASPTPRMNVSDFIEEKDSEGRVPPIIGQRVGDLEWTGNWPPAPVRLRAKALDSG